MRLVAEKPVTSWVELKMRAFFIIVKEIEDGLSVVNLCSLGKLCHSEGVPTYIVSNLSSERQ